MLLTQDIILLDAKDNMDQTALILAVRFQSTSVVQRLLKEDKIDVNAKDSHGVTALMLAVEENCPDILKALLIQKSIDVNVKTNKGATALKLAHQTGKIDIVKTFLYLDDFFDIDISGDDRFVLTTGVASIESFYTRLKIELHRLFSILKR